MEWYVTFYEERLGSKYVNRVVRILVVLFFLCSAVIWVNTWRPEAAGSGSGSAGAYTDMTADGELLVREVLGPVEESVSYPGRAYFLFSVEGMASVLPAPAVPADAEETVYEPAAPVSGIMEFPGETTAPDITVDSGESVQEDTDSPAVPQEPRPDAGQTVVGGFLVNEAGMICGVADPSAAVSGGVMKIPSEGCSGIAAGAFLCGLPSVREISIPSNITRIETGAFRGLENAEWFSVESSGEFSAKMGVLMSEGGTCILAFPAGRIGSYKVPSQVTKFAEGAFAGSRLTVIDAVSCSLTDTGDVPSNIRILQRVEGEEDPGSAQEPENGVTTGSSPEPAV